MAQLRPSILYTLLLLGGALAGTALIVGVFYDSVKMEGNRYENSYEIFATKSLTDKETTAIQFLQKKGIEWAHFQFVDAIKAGDFDVVNAFITAGMTLNSNSILLELATGSLPSKKQMFELLLSNFELDLDKLYRLPNYVSAFDEQLSAVYFPYVNKQKEAHRLAMMAYKKAHITWEAELEKKKLEMMRACSNDACRSGRINDVHRMFAETEPVIPVLDYITRERVFVSLLTVFTWQKDHELISFIEDQGVELIPNKVFLTDKKLIYFTVDASGNSSIISIN